MLSQYKTIQRKINQEISNLETQNIFQGNSPLMQSEVQKKLDLNQSLKQADKYGHKLSKQHLPNSANTTVVQSKKELNKPIQCNSPTSERFPPTQQERTPDPLDSLLDGIIANSPIPRSELFPPAPSSIPSATTEPPTRGASLAANRNRKPLATTTTPEQVPPPRVSLHNPNAIPLATTPTPEQGRKVNKLRRITSKQFPQSRQSLELENVVANIELLPFLEKLEAEKEQELEALRGEKQPEPYKGEEGVGKDTRLMVEDPRFRTGYGYERGYGYQPGYKLERESDKKDLPQRLGPKGKKAVGGYKKQQQEELKADTGYYTAHAITNLLPFVGTGKHATSTYHEGKRQKVSEMVANNCADELTQSIATGLAKDHNKQKLVHGVQAAAGGALTIAGPSAIPGTVLKHGISAVGPSAAAVSAVGPSVTGAGKVPGLFADDRKTRLASVLPQQNGEDDSAHKKKVDDANSALVSLGRHDPDFARAMLTHLSQPELTQPQQVISALGGNKGKQDTSSGVVEEHTIKLSDVRRFEASEEARLRQRGRMKKAVDGSELDSLTTLRESEKKKWYEHQ